MVSFFQDKLATFGGYGIPTGPIQPGATFIKDPFDTGIGWSNELHVFDITTSMLGVCVGLYVCVCVTFAS